MLQNLDHYGSNFMPRANASLKEIYTQKTALIFHKGKPISVLDRDIYFVQQGIVQLSSFDSEGNYFFLGLIMPSMPFGLTLTCVDPYDAIALSNVSLIRFTVAEVENYLDLNRLFTCGLNLRVQQSEAIHSILCSPNISEKLYRFLVFLCEEIGEPVENGIRVKVRFTHQHLASSIGASRVTVTRILQRFQQHSIITLDKKRHIVMNSSNNSPLSSTSVVRSIY
jgi:CRP-like cAMP-binding protein